MLKCRVDGCNEDASYMLFHYDSKDKIEYIEGLCSTHKKQSERVYSGDTSRKRKEKRFKP